MQLFGYEINKKVSSKKEQELDITEIVSPVPISSDDGGASVTVGGGYYGQYVDLENTETISDHELMMQYRAAALQPECDAAISDIVDGAIANDDVSAPVDLAMNDLQLSEKVKGQIL